ERNAPGDRDAAEAIYREILAVQPGNALAQHFLGVIHYQRRDLATALPLLEGAASAQPAEPEFHNNLGLALAAADRESDAETAYRHAQALKRPHPVARSNLRLLLPARHK